MAKRTEIIAIARAAGVLAAGVPLLGGSGSAAWQIAAKLAILVCCTGLVTRWCVSKFGPRGTVRALVNMGLLGASCGGTLLIAELSVRYLFRDVTTTSDNSSYFARRWLREHPPDINSFGFREREVPVEKDPATYRIAVIGDSFTYGQGISEEDRLTEVLERKLSQVGGRVEVLNFGWPGAETVDEVVTLRERVLPVFPDFILLQWFINDVEGRDKSERPRPRRLIPSDFLTGFLHRHSGLFYLVDQKWRTWQVTLGLTQSYERYMTSRFRDGESPSSIAASTALREFFTQSKAAGVEVAAMLYPRLADRTMPDREEPLDFLIERALGICQEQGATCVDLRPMIASVTPASRLWANRLDSHPGRLANEMAASVLLQTLLPRWVQGPGDGGTGSR